MKKTISIAACLTAGAALLYVLTQPVVPQVRAAAIPSARFQVAPDGHEVLDLQTRLVWKRCAEGAQWDGHSCAGTLSEFTLALARKRDAEAQGAGSAWRMPTRDELTGIVAETKNEPVIDLGAFPDTPATVFWALRPGFNDNLNAWLVDFANGHVYGSVGSAHALRLVRNE